MILNLKFDGIEKLIQVQVALAAFGKPLDDRLVYARDRSFATARGLAEGGMGWIWSQWLSGASGSEISDVIEPFIERGMEIQKHLPHQRMRGLHDLFLLHCAIFASPTEQLRQLAERVVDAAGAKGESPLNDGDLLASAWSGMLKYWILGDKEGAQAQAGFIWDAYCPPYYRTSTKPLVGSWLSSNWKAFINQQHKDFAKLWAKANKNGTARSTKRCVTIHLTGFPVAQFWCWAHCGMAVLAYRQGVEVATDPFWFPPQALKCLEAAKFRVNLG